MKNTFQPPFWKKTKKTINKTFGCRNGLKLRPPQPQVLNLRLRPQNFGLWSNTGVQSCTVTGCLFTQPPMYCLCILLCMYNGSMERKQTSQALYSCFMHFFQRSFVYFLYFVEFNVLKLRNLFQSFLNLEQASKCLSQNH